MTEGPVVVDASFVAAFLLGEELGDRFSNLLRHQEMASGLILVPDLFGYEIRNVLLMASRRGRINDDHTHFLLGILEELPLETASLMKGTSSRETFRISKEYGLTFYDASYVEVSRRVGGTLFTFDRDLLGCRISGVHITHGG